MDVDEVRAAHVNAQQDLVERLLAQPVEWAEGGGPVAQAR